MFLTSTMSSARTRRFPYWPGKMIQSNSQTLPLSGSLPWLRGIQITSSFGTNCLPPKHSIERPDVLYSAPWNHARRSFQLFKQYVLLHLRTT